MRVSIPIITGQQAVNSAQKMLALAANLGANSLGRLAAQIVVVDFALKEPFMSFRKYVAQNGFDQFGRIFSKNLDATLCDLWHVGIVLEQDHGPFTKLDGTTTDQFLEQHPGRQVASQLAC